MPDPSTPPSTLSPRFPEFTDAAEVALLIDGEAVPATDGRTFSCRDPYEDREWGRVAQGGADDVDLAVGAARRAFPSWRSTSQGERSRLMARWGELIAAHAVELGRLQVHENGKTIAEMHGAALYCADLAAYFAHLAGNDHGVTIDPGLPGHQAWTRRGPIGVVGAITPWNNPLGLLCPKLFPAVAVGNTVVIKPSEVTPASTVRLAQLALEAGLPPGVVNVVTGDGEAGRALAQHLDVDKLAFTGSTTTGRAIARGAAERFAHVTLELGGKGPQIVFADADLERALPSLLAGITAGNGQACNAGSRILVHQDVYDEVVDRLGALLARMKLGDPLEPSTEMGPMASRPQHAKVLDYLEVARQEGHRLVTGGRAPSDDADLVRGLFVEPTLYAEVDNRSRLAQEEIFGPVGAAMRFATDEEAVRLANDTAYGLTAGLWTSSLDRAHRLQDELRSGVVWINTWRRFSPRLPFGGVKASGIGSEGGLQALDAYTETKAVYLGMAGA